MNSGSLKKKTVSLSLYICIYSQKLGSHREAITGKRRGPPDPLGRMFPFFYIIMMLLLFFLEEKMLLSIWLEQ